MKISLVFCSVTLAFLLAVCPDAITQPEQQHTKMVLIPAGAFEMGSTDAEAGGSDEQPVHTVYLDAFYMDMYEVTNAEYAAFLNAQGKHTDGEIRWFDLGDSESDIDNL